MPRRIVKHHAEVQRVPLSRARTLRSESALWRELKGKQIYGYSFDRAHRLDRDCVDFYCEALRLAIQVDRIVRKDERALRNEMRRIGRLIGRGITVLRFTDDEIMHNPDGVVGSIRRWIRTRPERWGLGAKPAGAPAVWRESDACDARAESYRAGSAREALRSSARS